MRHLRTVRTWCLVATLVLVVQVMPANSLAATGSISGSIEDTGGSAIRNICVEVFDAVTGTRVQRNLTDANGRYTATELAAGSYTVFFRDCVAPLDYASEWNDNVRDESLATPVVVTIGQDTVVNAALDRWGAITGIVEDGGGSAIRDICVRAFEAGVTGGNGAGWARTDANGMYTLKIRTLFGTGSYKVRFYDCLGPKDYALEWYDNVRRRKPSTPVTVTVGQTTSGINAALDPWGAIAGSVEDTGGSAIPNICVRIIDDQGKGAGWTRTDANGMYTVKVRSLSQNVKVHFYDCVGPSDFAPEWNDNSLSKRHAPWVPVALGQTTRVNAAMDRWGAITGTVEDTGGSAIRDICVSVFSSRRTRVGWARTDANGRYAVKIRSIFGGNFKVRFRDCVAPRDFPREWYLDQRFSRRATGVNVTLDHDTVVNAALDRWGAISGRVTDVATTDPIPNICVRAVGPGGRGAGWARTNADGRYTLQVRSLLGGRFKVAFSECIDHRGYIPEIYDNAPDKWHPTWVTVSPGQNATGIDASLARFGSISGTITDDVTGETLSDICVRVSDTITQRRVASTRTNADGTYTLASLVSGDYKVEFSDCVTPIDYNVLWYRNGQNWNQADAVHVTAGAVTGNVNGALVPNRSFTLSANKIGGGSGTVTSQPAGIACGSDCTQDYLRGTTVTLTASADPGSTFLGWSGACGGTAPQSSVKVDANKTCAAEFSGSSTPTITSFTPTKGKVGTSVTITGTNFPGTTTVRFGAISAAFTVNSPTSIVAIVPAGASAGFILVTTPAGTATSLGTFAVVHARKVTLELRRSRFAAGVVSVTDGFGGCSQGVGVEVQRFSDGSWHLVTDAITSADGSYSVSLRNAEGKFRAKLERVTLSAGDICGDAISPQPQH